MATKNLIFRGDVGKAYTVDVESLDGSTSVQTGISATQVNPGTYTAPITAVVDSDLTTYVTKINLGGSLAIFYGTDLKEVAGTYYATELPTPLMNATVSNGGSGANSVTITVENEDGDPLQNATVTAKLNGSISDTGLTDIDGEYILHLDDGTYSLAITCPGYTGAGDPALVVNGDETPPAYTLTALSITPSDPPFVTGYLVTRVAGVATAGIEVTVTMVALAPDDEGNAYTGAAVSVVSDGAGVAAFPNLIPESTYSVCVGPKDSGWSADFVAQNTTFEIGSFIV